MARDPVCKMEVKEGQAAAKTQYMGETYYFCSTNCRAEFEKNPKKYVQAGHGHEGHYHGH